MAKKTKLPKYRTLTLDAKEIYELYLSNQDYNVYSDDGGIDYDRFNSFLYNSLEVNKLKEEYEKAKARRALNGKFELGKYVVGDDESGSTLAVITVTFEKDVLEFRRKKSYKGYVYIRVGNEINFTTDIVDHVCIRDDKLIAVEVPYEKDGEYSVGSDKYKEVENPCEKKLLEGLFQYDAALKCYTRTKKDFPVKVKKDKLREYLYENGFYIEGKKPTHYVRYKRSAGSSRQGNCLFIAEPLYKGMMKWSSCGLDLDKVKDQTSKESYISLTLSNMEKEIDVPIESILILPDAESIFNDKVVVVEKDTACSNLVAQEKDVTVENKIWDGQGLLDSSVFIENGYESKGMMLLRNRFFKTCAFNTNIQKWFKDNGITSVSQLNPRVITRAKNIEDIKLIVTDSSIKYIKLHGGEREKAINAWLDNVSSGFGLVKTEKPTKHMYGNMVQTSYQLLNTLELTTSDVEELLKDALEYLWNIQSDPMYMRHFIKMQLGNDHLSEDSILSDDEDDELDDSADCEDEEDGEGSEVVNSMRKNVMMKLLSLNDRFADTKTYSEFRTQTKKAIIAALRQGHLLVHGTNATLFGNGYEMLRSVTDKEYDFDNPKQYALQKGQIRISKFDNEKKLLCARSPHITMGNVYLCENKIGEDDVYSTYFNLTPEIVCVNSIEENLLQRLNGCDFDSDMMLVTDNEIMLNSAKKNYGKFAVPYCNVSSVLKSEPIHLVDTNISNNKIGEIVNLSQWLNSIYWDKLSKGEDDKELYLEICKLAVLSGMEIDKAKRDYGIQATAVLNSVRKATKVKSYSKPQFYKYLKSAAKAKNKASKVKDGSEDKKPEVEYDETIETAMQRVVNCVNSQKRKSPRTSKNRIMTLSGLLPELKGKIKQADIDNANEIIDELLEKQKELKQIRNMMRKVTESEKTAKMYKCRAIEYECVECVYKKMKSMATLYLLVGELDNEDSRAKSCASLLLSAICSASDDFYKLVAETRQPMYSLVYDENGEYDIYGYKHSAQEIKK